MLIIICARENDKYNLYIDDYDMDKGIVKLGRINFDLEMPAYAQDTKETLKPALILTRKQLSDLRSEIDEWLEGK